MEPVLKLKLKYRNPAGKRIHARPWETPTGERAGVLFTWVYQAGRFTSKSSNAGHGKKAVSSQGWMPRRRSYFCDTCGPR